MKGCGGHEDGGGGGGFLQGGGGGGFQPPLPRWCEVLEAPKAVKKISGLIGVKGAREKF